MHEILLFTRDLTAPLETSLFEQRDNIAVLVERSWRAGPPFAASHQTALRAERNAVVVQTVLFRIDVDGRSKRMIAETNAVAVPVSRSARLDHSVADDGMDRHTFSR